MQGMITKKRLIKENMANFNFSEIEQKWQTYWKEHQVFKTVNNSKLPKYYILDMFPYPSGSGLHVGHPLGYIATDIMARYKMHRGFNVLHPMGFDAFGLPAEQYAIQTGQHPAITTRQNIERYKEQLENIGFSYDWDREVKTSDPQYYKWTQWIFKQIFNSWFDFSEQKARPIEELIRIFRNEGNAGIHAACDEDTPHFTANEWRNYNEQQKYNTLLRYRLTYLAETEVNWCPELGTVLANDEVKDGLSERGGYPVERKKMRQWMMRITAYAERLLEGLNTIDWPEPVKEMQRNWIGKSNGCSLDFKVVRDNGEPVMNNSGVPMTLTVFTTRVDTAFGVTFMTMAPEHELLPLLTTLEQKNELEAYVHQAKNRSERDRMSDTKTISGVFTGSYAVNPFNGEKVPIWIADYVLAGYGTGVVMAVPASDTRDYAFARHFGLSIIPVQEGKGTDISKDDFDARNGTMINSGFLNGLSVPEAIKKAVEWVEQKGIGQAHTTYRMRDAVFSRQRYWGEPVPVYFRDGIPFALDDAQLPLKLPQVDQYLPTKTGEPPLGRASEWKHETREGSYDYEWSTMPGWAGSSWYFFRYMDARNPSEFASKDALNYWKSVDLYVGGTEHAVGHLLYSRFWTKILFDLGHVPVDEPFSKMINQGMIQGRSCFVYRDKQTGNLVSKNLTKGRELVPLHVDIGLVNEKDELDIEGFKNWRPEYKNTEFELEAGSYLCGYDVEKMSKSKYNVVNPDQVIAEYGADALRLYEMFLGPVEQSKPWSTHGIDGVFKFQRKFWRLIFSDEGELILEDNKPTAEELKILHQTIKKVTDDIERFSFNTVVSNLMIAVNELSALKCNNRSIMKEMIVLLSPLAPHLAEEMWEGIGEKPSVSRQPYPVFNADFVKEDSFEYPVSINGKMRTKITFGLDETQDSIQEQVLKDVVVQKWVEGKAPKKVIIVPKRIINIVV